MADCRHRLPGFNSTLVQLKEFYQAADICFEIRFNSTLVQLKDCIHDVVKFIYRRFNSTLVQLKEYRFIKLVIY